MIRSYFALASLTAGLALGAGGCSTSMAKSPPTREETPATAAPTPPAATPAQEPATAKATQDCRCTADDGETAARELARALRARLVEVEARELAVARREADLNTTEKRIQGEIEPRIAEAHRLEERLGITQPLPGSHGDKVQALAESLRTLSPRKAAPIVANADVALAVTLLARLGTERSGALLAQMEPTQAARLVNELARQAPPKRAPEPAPADTNKGVHRPDRKKDGHR